MKMLLKRFLHFMTSKNSKLGLGTVQFGLNYGVSNKHGQTDTSEVGNILTTALQN